jgi:hypothetical protein
MAMAVGISAGFPSRRKRESARAPGLPDRTPFLFYLSQDQEPELETGRVAGLNAL